MVMFQLPFPIPSFDPSDIGKILNPGGIDQNLIIEAIIFFVIVIIAWKVISANLEQ